MQNTSLNHLAFVTDMDHPTGAEDDKILVHHLHTNHFIISPVVWNDPSVDWYAFDCILLRSPWDYFLNIEKFDEWLEMLSKAKLRVFNPVSVLHWNKNKNYLLRFRDLGVFIPEFQYCLHGEQVHLETVLQKNHWEKAVVKPGISGGAYKTWVIQSGNAHLLQDDFNALIQNRDVIIQKFSEEIIVRGEISIIYFNKKFSHAVLKKAKQGEFRVQSQYGGHHVPYVPDEKTRMYVEGILSLIQEPLLFARVDGFLDDRDQFWLMELELLEPVLFFDSDPLACHRFCDALMELSL